MNTGFETVNARTIAGKLKCSTRPIFTCYSNMDGMKQRIFTGKSETKKKRKFL